MVSIEFGGNGGEDGPKEPDAPKEPQYERGQSLDRLKRAQRFEKLMAEEAVRLNLEEERARREGRPVPDRQAGLEEATRRLAYVLAEAEGLPEHVYVVNPLCVAAQSDEVRRGFLRKVFGIVAMQLGLMTVIMAALVTTPAGWAALLNAWWLLWGCMFALVPTVAALFAYRDRHPHNLVLFTATTVLLGVFFGMCCSVLGNTAFFAIVGACFAVVCTLYLLVTYVSWRRLTGDIIFIALAPIACATSIGTAMLWPQSSWLYPVCAGLVIIFFGFWLYCDAAAIQIDLTVDDYIIGAFDIFIDVVQMFAWLVMCCIYAATGRS